MASFVSEQDEPNLALWLATRAGKMALSCQSVDENPVCDHSNESYWAVLSCDTVSCVVLYKLLVSLFECGQSWKWKVFIVSVVWTMSMKKLETKQLSVRLTKSKLLLTLAGCQVCLSFFFKIYIVVNCYLNFYVISQPVNNCLWYRIGCFVTIYFSSIKGLWSTLCYIRKEGNVTVWEPSENV